MRNTPVLWIVTFLAFLTIVPLSAEIVDSRSGEFAAGDLSSVDLRVGAGSLEIQGSPTASSIHVQADFDVKASGSRIQEILAGMRFDATPRGNTLYIESETDGDYQDGESARINVIVTMPARMAAAVRDGSGSMKLRGIQGDVTIHDGSGDIDVAEAGGNLTIRDGSGGIELAGVGGTTEIHDGSGSINIRDAMAVTLTDSSGDIDVDGAGGDVVVMSDSSGGIDVHNVEGDFEVRRDSSGGVRYSGIRGTVRVPRS